MKRLVLPVLSLLVAPGCLEVETISFSFDLSSMTGELRYIDIRSDSESNADEDYAKLVTDYVEGGALEKDHPGWTITSKELYEADGVLNGRVRFAFRTLDSVHIYKHDKKSPYIFCADETVVSTNGTDISDVLDDCVVWERKQKELEVSMAGGTGKADGSVSLLGRHQAAQREQASPE